MNGFSAVVSQITVLKNAPIASPKRKKGPIRFPPAPMADLRPEQVAAVKAFMIPKELHTTASTSNIHPASSGEEDPFRVSSQKRRIEEGEDPALELAKKKRV